MSGTGKQPLEAIIPTYICIVNELLLMDPSGTSEGVPVISNNYE